MTGEEAGPKEVAALYISKQPKIDYFVGDTLDLSEGRFKVLYDDETETEHSFTVPRSRNLQAMILKKQAVKNFSCTIKDKLSTLMF